MVSQIRSGRVLGRCHAALAQHQLSCSAYDAALETSKAGRLLMAESLTVRARAAAGLAASGSGAHWSRYTGQQRLAELIGRMQGERSVLEAALAIPEPEEEGV